MWYATTCGGCSARCSLLVKTRDGRPIKKVDGNPEAPIFSGGTCAVEATVLSLYDDERLRGPLWHGRPVSWDYADARIDEQLQTAVVDHRRIVLLTGTINGPATRDLIRRWSRRYDRFRHVVYDAVSFTAIRRAYDRCFGRAIVPHFRLDRALAHDADVAALVADMRRGDVGALLIHGVDPAYDYAEATSFSESVKNVDLVVSFADRLDETAALAHAVCPDHHFLESWGDAEPVASTYGLLQPTIAPLFETRAVQDSLLKWLGESPDFHAYLRAYWKSHIFPRQQVERDFDRFWDRALRAGFIELSLEPGARNLEPPTVDVTGTTVGLGVHIGVGF
jgi:anaerobic selenocysteine-containing dehydrogenase